MYIFYIIPNILYFTNIRFILLIILLTLLKSKYFVIGKELQEFIESHQIYLFINIHNI